MSLSIVIITGERGGRKRFEVGMWWSDRNLLSSVMDFRFNVRLNLNADLPCQLPENLPRCVHSGCKCTKIFSGFTLCLPTVNCPAHQQPWSHTLWLWFTYSWVISESRVLKTIKKKKKFLIAYVTDHPPDSNAPKSSKFQQYLCLNSVNQSINQNPWRPGVVGGTPTDASTATAAHRRLSSATQSNDDTDWPAHSLMLSLHDLRGLPLFKFWAICILADMSSTAHKNTSVNVRKLFPSTKAQNGAISKILDLGHKPSTRACERAPIFLYTGWQFGLSPFRKSSTVFEWPKLITAFSSYLSAKNSQSVDASKGLVENHCAVAMAPKGNTRIAWHVTPNHFPLSSQPFWSYGLKCAQYWVLISACVMAKEALKKL